MIITDAHAHIYPRYNLDTFISSAFQNFFQGGYTPEGSGNTAMLFLTETATTRCFEQLKDGGIPVHVPERPNSWSVVRTGEQLSLRITHCAHPGKELFIISGQQLVTKEKLEVLAIGCYSIFPDGEPLTDTVRSIFSAEGLVILPWGVGKWLGRRGHIIDAFCAAQSNAHLFLGDNGSRPSCWPVSRLDRPVKTRCPRLLSGTDPLPLPGEENRAGRFGSIIHGSIDPQKPAETLKKLLLRPETVITGYGALQSPIGFVKQQVALRMAR